MRPPGWTITLVSLLLIMAVPSVARADLAEDIAAQFEAAMNSLKGTEIDPVTLQFAYKPPDLLQPPLPPVTFDSVHVEITFIGFAFCNPPDPWIDPATSPLAPLNAYGCQNVATVDATVNPMQTGSSMALEVSDFFLDFEYTREKTIACGEFTSGEVTSDAYLVTAASIAMTLDLGMVGDCMQATLVPGSVVLELEEKAHGFKDDTCLTLAWPLFSGLFTDLFSANASTALEVALTGIMSQFNTALCEATPVAESTWGGLKHRYQ